MNDFATDVIDVPVIEAMVQGDEHNDRFRAVMDLMIRCHSSRDEIKDFLANNFTRSILLNGVDDREVLHIDLVLMGLPVRTEGGEEFMSARKKSIERQKSIIRQVHDLIRDPQTRETGNRIFDVLQNERVFPNNESF